MNDRAKPSAVSALRFRPATAADRPSLIALVNSAYAIETFLQGTRTDETRLSAMMEKGTILVAENAGAKASSTPPLACVYFEVRGANGYLGQLAVDPAHQGRGLARILVQAAENQLRAAGCQAVEIVVLSMRPELLPIYRHFGYVETGIEESFRPTRVLAPGVKVHGIKMSKPL
jgi:ribosomal protein S18 acetylase RimI-like enzyme